MRMSKEKMSRSMGAKDTEIVMAMIATFVLIKLMKKTK